MIPRLQLLSIPPATNRPLWQRFIIAALCVAAATGVKSLLADYLGSRVPYVTYFAPVVIAALYGGLSGGLMATALSGIAAAFWVHPVNLLTYWAPSDWVPMVTFLISGALVSCVCEAMLRAQARLLAVERQAVLAAEYERELLQRYELLAQHSRDIILFVRRSDGRILEANEAALRAYGLDRESLLSRTIKDLRAPDTRDLTAVQMEDAEAAGILFETVHVRADGSTFPVEVSARGVTIDSERTIISVIRDITERRQAGEALRRSEEKFAKAFAANPAAIALTRIDDGRFLDVNDTWVEMMGYSREEALASTASTLPIWPSAEERTRFVEDLRSSGSVRGREQSFHRKSGEDLISLLSAEVLTVGGEELVLSTLLDITARKRAEESQRNQRAVLAQAGTMAHLGAWELTYRYDQAEAASTLRWSDEVFRIYGYEPGSVPVSRDLFLQHVHPDDRDRVTTSMSRAVAQRQLYEVEHRIVRPDGVERVVLEHAQITCDDKGRPTQILGAVQDISEQKRLEGELQERAEALAHADRAKDEFLAMLAHELRNPLGAIGNAAMLLEQNLRGQSELEKPVAILSRQVKHTSRLVDDLLDVSRITRGKLELRREMVDLVATARRAAETAEPQMRLFEHTFQVSFPPDPVYVHGDPARLEQILGNLLHNAAKYTEPGGFVELGLSCNDASAVVSVRDTGVGIPPEMLVRVFDLFAQADRSLARSHGGLGIGLTLVKMLVQMHGGTVQAESAGLGQGSVFTVHLPLTEAAVPLERPAAPRAVARNGPATVLVVDDNVDAARTLAEILEMWGHSTHMAHDGLTALEAAHKHRPDIVLLDLGLPGMDGYEVARHLRDEEGFAPEQLVAVTGYGRADDRRRSTSAGFGSHLVKPVDMGALRKLLSGPAL